MNLKYFLLPIIGVCLGSSLQAQTAATPTATPPSPGVGAYGGGWHHRHGGGLFRQLQLTAAQRQQLEAYRTSNQAAFRSALLAYLQAKAALQTAISQNNTGNLAGLASNLATAQTQLIQLRAQKEAYLYSILTSAQQTIWNQIQAQKASRLQDRINELQAQ